MPSPLNALKTAAGRLLSRLGTSIGDLARRLLRRPPKGQPGYSITGSTWSASGWLAISPLTLPRRKYLLYVPRGFHEEGQPSAQAASSTTELPSTRRWPLVVWIHGCKQSPEEFRDGTRVTAAADRHGWLVLMPRQTRTANPFRCWNWFDRGTREGGGEVALVLAQIDEISEAWAVDQARIAVAGLSSGAALAAALAVNAPDRLAAVACVAGLACGAASTMTARDVMQSQPDIDVTTVVRTRRRLPALIVQGEDDPVVAPAHAVELTRQMLAINDSRPVASPLRAPDHTSEKTLQGRVVRRRRFDVDGQARVQLVTIGGLGHAWSGGDPAFDYQDPHAPDVTTLVADFFLDAFRRPKLA